MLRAKNIWVVGGDPRQAALAELLADDGHSVHTYALEEDGEMKCEPSMEGADRADCVVLPLPAGGRDGMLNAPLAGEPHKLSEVLDALRPGQLVCAGMAKEELKRMAAERKLELRDYFAREELAVLNAIPVALAVWQHKIHCPRCQNGVGPNDYADAQESYELAVHWQRPLCKLLNSGELKEFRIERQWRMTRDSLQELTFCLNYV